MFRRGFLGRLAAGAAAFGVADAIAPARAGARGLRHNSADPEFEAWLGKITGKHKILFDVPQPNSGFGLIWARVFLNSTNDLYGTTDADNTVVVVLRHGGIPLGMQSGMWAKYKFGEFFKITDAATKAPAVRNPHVKPAEPMLPGSGLDDLAAKGVLFGICNVALTVYSGMFAKTMGLEANAVKADWVANLVPGVQIVPSGVIAVSRGQERGCAYCFAG